MRRRSGGQHRLGDLEGNDSADRCCRAGDTGHGGYGWCAPEQPVSVAWGAGGQRFRGIAAVELVTPDIRHRPGTADQSLVHHRIRRSAWRPRGQRFRGVAAAGAGDAGHGHRSCTADQAASIARGPRGQRFRRLAAAGLVMLDMAGCHRPPDWPFDLTSRAAIPRNRRCRGWPCRARRFPGPLEAVTCARCRRGSDDSAESPPNVLAGSPEGHQGLSRTARWGIPCTWMRLRPTS